jgi:hypothetical protein
MISPEVEEFLNYLKEKGVIKGGRLILSKRLEGRAGEGEFSPSNKQIDVSAADEYSGDFAAMHEAVHALLKSELKSNTKAYKELYDRLPFMEKWRGVTKPSHWSKDMIDNPLTGGVDKIWNIPPEEIQRGMFWNPVNQYSWRTARAMADAVRESIPPGRTWSGITRGTPNSTRGLPEEATANYLTNPKVMEDRDKRMTQLGMFLYDYNVPDEMVEKVLGRLKSYESSPDVEAVAARRWYWNSANGEGR